MRRKTITTSVKEITPFGVRQELNWQGEVAGGKFSASVTGTTKVDLKSDGTYDWAA